jgi:hypothetical protein
MTGLRDTLDDIADEIMPGEAPVHLTMLRGRRKRNGRRAAAGTAGVLALAAAAALGIPALASRPGHEGGAAASGTASVSAPVGGPLARPVLLFAPWGGGSDRFGDASLVNTTTMSLFDRLTCQPAANGRVVNDSWKASVGYTAGRWNAPDSQVVSCDAAGGRYVLGKAVILSTQVTSATPAVHRNAPQWYVDVKLNRAATRAFGTLTTNLYNNYYTAYQGSGGSDINAEVLAQVAIIINGDVRSSPTTSGPITAGQVEIAGPQPRGFTQAEAAALAAQL